MLVRPADIDETPFESEDPIIYVRRLAAAKAETVSRLIVIERGVRNIDHEGTVVLAADTTVTLDGLILGKPDDPAHAVAMLRSLRGRAHLVHSGVTLRHRGVATTIHVTTEVEFAKVSDAAIDWYVATGEPLDKAGAYGLQGCGGVFVRSVTGSVTNVVGLPMSETLELLGGAGITPGM